MKKIYGIGVFCAYLLAGCAGHSAEAGHDHDHDHEHEEAGHEEHDHAHEEAAAPGEVVFKEANAKAVGLQTVTVTPGVFTHVIRTS